MTASRHPWSHPLGLTKIEYNLICLTLHARTLVSNGHFLTGSGHQKRAAFKLVERGYLTKPVRDGDFVPDPSHWGIVVCIEQANIDKYNTDLTAAQQATNQG